MTLVKFAPMRGPWQTHHRLDRICDSFFSDTQLERSPESCNWSPRVDVEETDKALVLRADLPGLDKKDMHINVEDNRLTIRGERKSQSEEKDANFHRVERTYGTFTRSFTLPATVLADQMEASYRDGVLEVVIPKAEEVKPREIEIKS